MPKYTNDMPQPNTKYKEAYRYLSNWVAILDELTSVEANRMLKQSDLTPEQIPSRTTIHELLVEILGNHIPAIENMTERNQKTVRRTQRFKILEVIARNLVTKEDDPKIKFLS